MLTIICCAMLGLYVGFINTRKNPESKNWEYWGNCILGVMVGALVGMILACIFSTFLGDKQVQQNEYNKTEIVALTDNSQLSGSFFLASGSVGQEECYKFYSKTVGGGKKFDSLPAKDVIIYEENRNDAYISQIQTTENYPKIKQGIYLFIPKFLIYSGSHLTGQYAIHVPKGTIKVEENFRLDMK